MIKGSVQQEDITVVNINAPSIGPPKYVKQALIELKGELDCNSIMLGDLNTPLTAVDRSSRQKINKETMALNNTIDQVH